MDCWVSCSNQLNQKFKPMRKGEHYTHNSTWRTSYVSPIILHVACQKHRSIVLEIYLKGIWATCFAFIFADIAATNTWLFFTAHTLMRALIDRLIDSAGPDASITASKLDGAPDLQRALSLLSASSCGLPDPVQQASCLVQFAGASQNSRGLPSSHGGSSALASFAEGQPMATSPQLLRFTLDGSSNGYEPTFFGLNQMNWCAKRTSHCRRQELTQELLLSTY